MDQSILSSRAIIGAYYARLEQNPGLAWVNACSNMFNSDQASESYSWLGQSSAMREWIGGRQAKGLRGNQWTIANKHYENTLEIAKKDVRRDKTGQIMVRVQEFADRALTHWASLLSTLIIAGETGLCYDGQYYFDTDHTEGENVTSQSNDLSIDISGLPTGDAGNHGSTTVPHALEMQQCILQAVAAILAFKDDKGEPMNENARSFCVCVPVGLYMAALAAVQPALIVAAAANALPPNAIGMQFDVQMNPRLTWTTQFMVCRTDSPIKGLIRQTEQDVELKAKAEGSEFEFDNDAWQFGIDSWRNVGYGLWQRACLVTMT